MDNKLLTQLSIVVTLNRCVQSVGGPMDCVAS